MCAVSFFSSLGGDGMSQREGTGRYGWLLLNLIDGIDF